MRKIKILSCICMALIFTLTIFKGDAFASIPTMAYLYVDNSTFLVADDEVTNETVPNASYDQATNTLTLDNYTGRMIDVMNMGSDFKIKVIGTCTITDDEYCIGIYNGDLTLIGNGTLNLRGGSDSYGIIQNYESMDPVTTLVLNGPDVISDLPIRLGYGGSYTHPGKLVLQSGSITAAVSGGAMQIYGNGISIADGTDVTYKEGGSAETASAVTSLTDQWSDIDNAFCSKDYINIVAKVVKSVTASTTEELTTKALAEIANMGSTDVLSLSCQNGMQVDTSVLAAAKEKGIKVQISYVDSTGTTLATWSFDKITNAGKTFNPVLSIGTTVSEIDKRLSSLNNNYLTLSFNYSGDLPGTAEMTLFLNGSQLAKYPNGSTLYYYYYNPSTKLFELVDSAVVNNNSIELTMTHCSEYILTDQKLTAAYTTATSVKTGDNVNTIPYLAVMCIAIGAVAVVIFKKRQYN